MTPPRDGVGNNRSHDSFFQNFGGGLLPFKKCCTTKPTYFQNQLVEIFTVVLLFCDSCCGGIPQFGQGFRWTDTVTDDDELWWRDWFVALDQLTKMELPRCLFPRRTDIIETELHTFCDASEEAYAAVVYVRNTYIGGGVLVRGVKAANKFAPIKTVSVPKLELNAALLGSRLARTVQSAIRSKIHRRRFWTDSSTVQNWIRGTAAYYQVYVSNRVGEIQTLAEPSQVNST